ncbi:Translocation protein SEC63 -like protein [Sarcoptes scabiei]|uniref:Translocation protein SEC63 -like protein n=1 Tax=Sarcoptes scabiei TaxID=52283 RepID=A0A834RCQ4_SARSC|nr:Translocation protein SEC63 -like protein [Sarcoptes scabiei]
MAGTKFQYDESGTTFYYFVLAFLTMILAPCTYFFWPRANESSKKSSKNLNDNSRSKQFAKCHCEPCVLKEHYMQLEEPSKNVWKRLTKFGLILTWIGLIAFAYKVSEIQPDYVTFDPFEILGIDPQSSGNEIKKAYRRLSLIYHPDKETGDEKKFMKITKAYAALTDEQARKNWEEYGNPDGPGAMSFGIALPSWIVEKENSVFVLLVYVLMLMIVLPVCVRIWWSNSSKYGDFKVLIETSQLYFYFINKSPHMMLRRVVMIICASYEFEKSHNSEIQEHPSDNVEIPKLIKQIPYLAINNRERPLYFEYSLKARILLYAHLLRIPLLSATLEQDKKYILTKIPCLIQEFVQCSSQLTFLYLAQRVSRCPSLETIENAMKISAMTVQALWSNKSSILQLPHITEDMLRYFMNRRRNIRNMQQLASLADDDRRQMLSRLTEDQYLDVINVLGQMPLLDVDVRSEVIDDEDTATITAGALVTVFVKLTRKPLSSLLNDHRSSTEAYDQDHQMIGEKPDTLLNKKSQHKPWDKSKQNKGGKKKSKPKKKILNQQQLRNKQNQSQIKNLNLKKNEENSDSEEEESALMDRSVNNRTEFDSVTESKKNYKQFSTDKESETNDDLAEDPQNNTQTDNNDDNDDDDDWSSVKKNLPKKEIFKAISKISHSVHCPYYFEDKQEHWWIYITDKKKMSLKTIPYFMTNLIDTEEIELKFIAPQEPGTYQYMVNVRCDSYVDMDYFKNLKLDVKEAPKEIVSHPQWDISEEEDGALSYDDSAASDSDLVVSDEDDEDRVEDSSKRYSDRKAKRTNVNDEDSEGHQEYEIEEDDDDDYCDDDENN